MNYSAAIIHELAVSDPINDALLIYTDYGKSKFPRARTAQLVARFGESEGHALRQRIIALLSELQQPCAMPEGRSRKSVTERALEQLRPSHPELNETGLKALAWTYAFGLR
ncbi:hypothetical protein [Devosia sp.]|uniref:hypothetical protein n=1 Tax=Devosia sp. TaxID=1871048 RepID=UPI003A91D746